MKSTVRDVMTTRVIWVKKGASFRELAAAFRECQEIARRVRHVQGVVAVRDRLTYPPAD